MKSRTVKVINLMANSIFIEQMKSRNLYFGDDLTQLHIDKEIISKINSDCASAYRIIPVSVTDNNLLLVTSINSSVAFMNQEKIGQILNNQPFTIKVADDDNFKMALAYYYHGDGYSSSASLRADDNIDDDITPLKSRINEMIHDAINKNVSDIHLQPMMDKLHVFFRIYGRMTELTDTYNFSSDEIMNVTNIIKGMDTSSNADANEANRSNKGRFAIRHGMGVVDVRLSTFPVGGSDNGYQHVNLRILQAKKIMDMNELGYLDDDLSVIKRVLYSTANGLFILSGPTGAGKTNSLYAMARYYRESTGQPIHIITIDDPIEIREPSFSQVQVRVASRAELSLLPADIIHVGLRSDPDAFIYNEIRTDDDAQRAVEASETGHKVFTTVHAKGCVATIARLLDLNVSKMSLLSELSLIVSQRLVGLVCPYCSHEHTLTEQEKSALTDDEIRYLESGKLRSISPAGCPHCQYGLIGRTAVAEYVVFDDTLRDIFYHQTSFLQIREVLKKRHFVTMWKKGLALVHDGKADLHDVIQIIGKEGE